MSYTQKLVINACKNRHLFQYGFADYTEYIQIIKIKLDKRRTIGVKLNIQSKFMCLPCLIMQPVMHTILITSVLKEKNYLLKFLLAAEWHENWIKTRFVLDYFAN